MLRADGTLNVTELLALVWKRKWIVLAIGLVGVIGGVALAQNRQPAWRADGLIVLQPTDASAVPLAEISPNRVEEAWVRAETEVLRGRDLALLVVDQLQLVNDPDFNASLRDPTFLGKLVADARLTIMGKAEAPADPEQIRLSVGEAVRSHLEVWSTERSNAIGLAFESPDPKKSAIILNSLMKTYLGAQLNQKVTFSRESSRWLEERIDRMRQEVASAEQAVQTFRTDNGLVTSRNGPVYGQQIAEMNSELIKARADLAVAQAKWQEAKAALDRSGIVAAAESIDNAAVRELRLRVADVNGRLSDIRTNLGDRHPAVQAVQKEYQTLIAEVEAEVKRVMDGLRAQSTIASSRVAALEAEFKKISKQNNNQGLAELEMERLLREVETRRLVLQSFLDSLQRRESASELGRPDARIVSHAATPLFPNGPGTVIFAALGGMVGGGSGLAIVLGLALTMLGYTDLTRAASDLSCRGLGALPRMRLKRRGGKDRDFLDTGATGTEIESARGIVTAVQSNLRYKRAMLLAICSALPGDGKTTVTVALARACAADKRTVLVIDGDLRRQTLSSTMRANLVGDTHFEEFGAILKVDSASSVHVIEFDQATINQAPASLTSGSFAKLIHLMMRHYDVILIDTPPIMRVCDALNIAPQADGVIFVMRAGKTPRAQIKVAVDRLKSTGAEVGLLLNDVKNAGSQPYIYSGYS